jgi:hypothetical protein
MAHIRRSFVVVARGPGAGQPELALSTVFQAVVHGTFWKMILQPPSRTGGLESSLNV